MKAVSIRDAQGQLGQLFAAACRGELIVLTDGDRQVTLEPRALLDLEEDSPELEAELLKAVNGPHAALRDGELREIADRALADHRRQRK
jgi:hypothetical protein